MAHATAAPYTPSRRHTHIDDIKRRERITTAEQLVKLAEDVRTGTAKGGLFILPATEVAKLMNTDPTVHWNIIFSNAKPRYGADISPKLVVVQSEDQARYESERLIHLG